MNILIYSTQPVITNMITNILSDDNITVSTNPNGFVNNDYNLIIVEDNLFNENIFSHSIPVLYVTTSSYLNFCMVAVSHGGGYIFKPFTPDELISVVNKLTGNSN